MKRNALVVAAALGFLALASVSSHAQVSSSTGAEVKVPGASVGGAHGTTIGPGGAATGSTIDATVPGGGVKAGHATTVKLPDNVPKPPGMK